MFGSSIILFNGATTAATNRGSYMLTARQMENRKNRLWNLAHQSLKISVISAGITCADVATVEFKKPCGELVELTGSYKEVKTHLQKIIA